MLGSYGVREGIWKHDLPSRANHHLHAAQFATAISNWHSADC